MGICDFIADACKGFLIILSLMFLCAMIFEWGCIKEGLGLIGAIVFIYWLRKD